MTQSTTIAGVIFDIDGVLCDSEPFIIQAAQQMFAERYNVKTTAADFQPFTGMGEAQFIGGPALKLGLTIDLVSDKKRTYEIYLQMIRGTLPPLPGAIDFIHQLRKNGIRTACASSADRMKVEGNLAQIGLPAAGFHAVITGSDVQRHKPDPEIFLKAASAMNLSPPLCMVVEDAPAGCQGARAAGMVCLGITSSFSAETLKRAGAMWTAANLVNPPPWASAE